VAENAAKLVRFKHATFVTGPADFFKFSKGLDDTVGPLRVDCRGSCPYTRS